jgi:hypothetical protein
MAESMRWVRKIEEGILTDQNKKGNKNMEGFLDCWKLKF